MADKNICTIESLASSSNNTNMIVEENGSLHRLNLNDAVSEHVNNMKSEVVSEMKKSYFKAYLSPEVTCTNIESVLPLTKYCGDDNAFEIIDGKIHILKNCTIVIGASVYLYEGFTAGDIVSAYVKVTGNNETSILCRSATRLYYANCYQFMCCNTVHELSEGDVITLEAKNQDGARGTIMGGWGNTFLTMYEL